MKGKIKASGDVIEVSLTKLDTQFGIQEFTDTDGEKYQFYELEFLHDTPEQVTIDGYVARDKVGTNFFTTLEPTRASEYWKCADYIILPKNSFPEVTWESEPKRVQITLTPMEE